MIPREVASSTILRIAGVSAFAGQASERLMTCAPERIAVAVRVDPRERVAVLTGLCFAGLVLGECLALAFLADNSSLQIRTSCVDTGIEHGNHDLSTLPARDRIVRLEMHVLARAP